MAADRPHPERGPDRPQPGAAQRAAREAARVERLKQQKRQRLAVLGSALATITVLALIAILLTNRSGDDTTLAAPPAPSAAAPASPSAATVPPSPGASPSRSTAAGACSYQPSTSGPASRPAPTPPATPVRGRSTATMVTDQGTITFALLADKAPCTVNSLRSLATAKFFDDTPCHRLTTKSIFVLQCGDPTGEGSGGPGYQFAEENLTGASYPRGTVAMARAGRGTNGSQFFLVYKDSPLPPEYTPFGRVTGGLDVLDKVAAAGAGSAGDGPPNLPVTVETLRVS